MLGLSLVLLPGMNAGGPRPRLDVGGAVTVTGALLLAVYAIVGGNEVGWTAPRTLLLLLAAAVLFAIFIAIEAVVAEPLMPLRFFRLKTLAASNAIGMLWSGAMFAWFFLSALYMQRVLGFTPMQVGLAFLPGNLIMAVCSLGISAWVVNRYGLRRPLVGGLACAALGLALFARAPVDGGFVVDVLPGMLLSGLGAGIAFNPLLLAAMSGVDERESGLASGIVNTSFMMGGALGLAVLASLAAAPVGPAGAGGAAEIATVNRGYQLAFAAGALLALIAAALGAWLVPERPSPAAEGTGAEAAGASAAE